MFKDKLTSFKLLTYNFENTHMKFRKPLKWCKALLRNYLNNANVSLSWFAWRVKSTRGSLYCRCNRKYR
ncbi:hypothetical protein A4H97_30380 [Niastella yeongjuensis]|uniref:Uncharacterized protein n=1 Tax=Niastella yeongjuensis TaxID=354355 RepID=A0A1V9EPQ0_9BACT|nr:hypothetical protein A4H97_30380 [Niastella yeongjuensis]SEP47965.1 hypothetical protein SAMN05660816_06674 [Niastella yeongjuensis]